jgi:hypothetical protein
LTMPELPDSFFNDREKDKSVPGPTGEQNTPWDNTNHDLAKYLNKAKPPVDPSELTPDRKIPVGQTIRGNLYYIYYIPVAFFAARLAVFRVKVIAVAGLLLILASGSFSQTAVAQSDCGCWIDTKTGKSVETAPVSAANKADMSDPLIAVRVGAARIDDTDRNRAFNPKTGQNFARTPHGCWIDTKTGKSVETAPVSAANKADMSDPLIAVRVGAARIDDTDRNRAFNAKTGQNFARVPCPPQTVTTKPPPPSTAVPKQALPAPPVSPPQGKPSDAKPAESVPPRVASAPPAPSPGTSTVPVIKDAKGQLPVRTARIGAASDFFTADLDVSPLWKIEAAGRTFTIVLLESQSGCCIKPRIVKGKFDPLIWTSDVEKYPYQRVRSITVTFDAGPPGQWTYSGGDYSASVPIPAGASRVTRIEMGVGYPADGLTQIVWEMGR